MKKIFYATFIGLVMTACAVEEMDPDKEILNVDASFIDDPQIEICGTAENYDFGSSGTLTVGNDDKNLYITLFAAEGQMLSKTFLHVADDFSDFPTVGQGNLPPGQMAHKMEFNPVKESYTFIFSRESIGATDICISIASMTSFTNGSTEWAGDLEGTKGNWSYFNYCYKICESNEPPVCPGDIYRTLCTSEIDNPTLGGFTTYYENQIQLAHLPLNGNWNPSLSDLYQVYIASDGIDIYTTDYTVSTEDCGEITLEVSVETVECN